MIIFLNGSFPDENKARIAPGDRGFTLGDGVFDTLLCLDGQPQYAREHFTRLLDHAAVLRIQTDQSPQTLAETAANLLRRNGFKKGRHVLRTTISRGPGERGLAPPATPAPTLLMRAYPIAEASEQQPVHAIIAQGTRRNGLSPFSRIKSLQYGDNLLALQEAQDKGAGEALLLNTANHVACATTGNIFILEEGRVLTPPLSDGVLDGITRALVMAQTGAVEQSLTVSRLQRAEGIYLTNSIIGVKPVDILDGAAIGSRNMLYDELIRCLSRRAAA